MTHAANPAALRDSYDYIVVGAGASGSVIAGELSKTGAEVLVDRVGARGYGPDDRQSQRLVLQRRQPP
jgi:choline dehydrogenase